MKNRSKLVVALLTAVTLSTMVADVWALVVKPMTVSSTCTATDGTCDSTGNNCTWTMTPIYGSTSSGTSTCQQQNRICSCGSSSW